MNQNGFASVPPPQLDAYQVRKNGTAVPNESGIYFIWEGPLVAYVGQSINLAQRLANHPHLRRSDRISYLCIDSSELFYHEAFYIGICRPSRNSIRKRGTPKTRSYQKHTKMGYTQIRVQKYADGRWGFDDYSSGKRVMIRRRSKEKADQHASDIANPLTNSHGELQINVKELAEFLEWKAGRAIKM